MAITKERTRRFLALGERVEGGVSQLTVIDLKPGSRNRRLRTLPVDESKGVFSAIGFSFDSKYIACVIGHTGLLWDWYKNNIIGREELQPGITRISVNPKDNHIISTTGTNHWKVWRVEEGMFKEQPMYSKLSQNQVFTDHDWVDDDTVIAITDMNEAFIAQNQQIVQYIEFSFGREVDQTVIAAGATCVVATERGFVISSDEGHLALWEANEEVRRDAEEFPSLFRLVKTWTCGKKQPIVSLALSNNKETLGVALTSNDIGTYSLLQVQSPEPPKFQIFCGGFHSGPIQGLDVAVQRPLIVTCSATDSTLRIWNYQSMTCELAKKLYVVERDEFDPAGETVTKPLLSVAFHPSGYYLAVGFVDKVRIFHLLHDELRFFREVAVGHCRIVRFSRGGHLLAVASGGSVYVYEAYTLRFMVLLEDHSSEVTDVAWDSLDRNLVTIGGDGAVFEYPTNTWVKDDNLFVNPEVEFSSVTVCDDKVFAVGMNKASTFVYEKGASEYSAPPNLRHLLYVSVQDKSLFLGATESGSVLDLSHSSSNPQSTGEELQVHKGPITAIKVSPDGRFVFTTGEDGSVFVLRVKDALDTVHIERSLLDGKEKDLVTRMVDDSLADTVLIQRNQVNKLRDTLLNEKKERENLKYAISQKLLARKAQHEERIRELKRNIQEEIQTQHNRLDEINYQKSKQEKDFLSKLHELEEKHNTDVDQLESTYERKLEIEEERFRQLEHDKVEMQQHFEAQLKTIDTKYAETKEALEEAYTEAYAKACQKLETTQKTCEDLSKVYEGRLQQQGKEHEAEVVDINLKYTQQLIDLNKLHDHLDAEKKELIEKHTAFNENKQRILQEIEKNRVEVSKKQQILFELRDKITNLETAIRDKEENISKKNSTADDYRQQIQELISASELLNEKKKEIDNEIQPKNEEIESLQTRIKNVRIDLADERKANDKLKREIHTKEDLLKRLQADNQVEQVSVQEIEATIQSIVNEIHHAVSSVHESRWPDELVKLYQNYVKEDSSKKKKKADSVKELEHQLKYMEKYIAGIRHSQKKVQEGFSNDMRKRTQENSTLIQELNKIRLENKKDDITIKQKQQQIEELKTQIEELKKQILDNGGRVSIERETAGRTREPAQTPFLNYLTKPTPLNLRKAARQDNQRVLDLETDLENQIELNEGLRLEVRQLRDTIATLSNQ